MPFEGTSLRPILEDPERAIVKSVALSTFPRCAHKGMPAYGARGQPGGADNSCLDVERTDFTWMGYTMRTDRWRYTVRRRQPSPVLCFLLCARCRDAMRWMARHR